MSDPYLSDKAQTISLSTFHAAPDLPVIQWRSDLLFKSLAGSISINLHH